MSACDRCGISAWHPEAFACTQTDCALRRAQVLPAAVTFPQDGSRHLAGGASPQDLAAGDFLPRCPVFHADADRPLRGTVASGNAIASSSRMERLQNNV
jgi:hypothetical protein